MKHGFLKVATYTPEIRVGDVSFNKGQITKAIEAADSSGVEILVFPELALSGVSAGDLFNFPNFLNEVKLALKEITGFTFGVKALIFVGFPFLLQDKVFNACACIKGGKVLGVTFKSKLSWLEKRFFADSFIGEKIDLFGEKTPFADNIIFIEEKSQANIVCRIGDDVYKEALASIIVNPTCSIATPSFLKKQSEILGVYSRVNNCAIISCGAGEGESTSEHVYSGYSAIYECGEALNSSQLFYSGLLFGEIDSKFLEFKSIKNKRNCEILSRVSFSLCEEEIKLNRKFAKTPYVNGGDLSEFTASLLDIQATGLARRVAHTYSKKIVVGLSGGLDSTLAILVARKASKKCNLTEKDVIAVTMPCFGTTSRTFLNSVALAKALGATLKKIDISKSVKRHLKDIKHPENLLNTTYENAQARERTQVLLDVANAVSGIVVGTGDLSEIALGWSTYNGDHMSNYAVNAGIPKTLMRALVENVAKSSKPKLREVLKDILNTPVSPELLPSDGENISQKTEEIVGPYVLHDFFLYHFIERGASPEKILYLATQTFNGEYTEQAIKFWLKRFMSRFFSQQFKRSCMPDGVVAGETSLSPRGGLMLPSDISGNNFIDF